MHEVTHAQAPPVRALVLRRLASAIPSYHPYPAVP